MSGKENPWSKNRREAIQKVKELIRVNEPVKNNRILALIDIELGKTEKTALSYLRTLQNADFIKFDGDKETWSIKK